MPVTSTRITDFLRDEGGAVTVDMVPLLAVCVGLGLAVMGVVTNGIEDLTSDTSDFVAGIELTSSFEAEEPLPVQDTSRGGTGIIRISGRVP